MLLAEIHGKRCQAARTDEDLLTSTIFGELRYLRASEFWSKLFEMCRTVEHHPTNLLHVLTSEGFDLNCVSPEIRFWPNAGNFGEPDILCTFDFAAKRLYVVVEVKLNSAKSSIGTNDQLKRYLEFARDLSAKNGTGDTGYVIYLTDAYAGQEIVDSIAAYESGDATKLIFGLQWADFVDVAELCGNESPILIDIAKFLRGRNLQHFRGYQATAGISCTGSFYSSTYFTFHGLDSAMLVHGEFYE